MKKNDEEWATVCKCEDKFMSKEYEVKCTELMPAFKTSEDSKLESKQPVQDSYSSENGSYLENLPKTNDLCNYQQRPPKRKAAIEARNNWKRQDPTIKMSKGYLNEHISPQHGWSYEDWLEYVEEEPYDIVYSSHKSLTKMPQECSDSSRSILDDLEQELSLYRDIAHATTYHGTEYNDLNENDVFPDNEENDEDENLHQLVGNKTSVKSGSVRFNVYDNGNSRPNSVEHFIPQNSCRFTSISDADMLQPLNSSFVRVPLSSTPLRLSPDHNLRLPAHPNTPPENSLSRHFGDFQEDSVTLGWRSRRIDYALYNRTGERREVERRRK